MRIALDTNRYTDFHRGDATARRVLETATEVYVPFAVVAELRSGFSLGGRSVENERIFRLFLSRPGILVLFADDATLTEYARLYKQLKNQGTPISINDIWIAALAVQHGLTLFSRDSHFGHLPQIPRI